MRLIRRKQFFVDSKVQGAMLLRLVAYWCFCVVAVAQVLLCWRIFAGPDGPFLSHFRYGELWDQYCPVVLASFLLLPFLLIDAVVFSNRFTGPVYRLRCSMIDLAAGKTVRPIKFRKNDYRPEMADEFNAVLAYVEKLRREAGQVPTGAQSSAEYPDEHEQPQLEEVAAR